MKKTFLKVAAVIAFAAFVATGSFAKGFGGLLSKAKEAVGISNSEESKETSNSKESAETQTSTSKEKGYSIVEWEKWEITECSVPFLVTAMRSDDFDPSYKYLNISESDFPNEETVVYLHAYIGDEDVKSLEIPEKINGYTVVGLNLYLGLPERIEVLTLPESIVFLGGYASDSLKTINFPNHSIKFPTAKDEIEGIKNRFTSDWFEDCKKLDEKSRSELRRVGYTGKI